MATEIDTPPNKKLKIDEDNSNLHEKINDLSSFKLLKVLHNNSQRKTVCLQGTFSNSTDAGLVILEKTAFEDSILKQEAGYFTDKSSLKKLFHNDVYGNYECFPVAELNCMYPKDLL